MVRHTEPCTDLEHSQELWERRGSRSETTLHSPVVEGLSRRNRSLETWCWAGLSYSPETAGLQRRVLSELTVTPVTWGAVVRDSSSDRRTLSK